MLAWVDRVAALKFTRVIPCHMANDVRASGADFKRAFAFLRPASASPGSASRVPQAAPQAQAADLAFLDRAQQFLTAIGVVAPARA